MYTHSHPACGEGSVNTHMCTHTHTHTHIHIYIYIYIITLYFIDKISKCKTKLVEYYSSCFGSD